MLIKNIKPPIWDEVHKHFEIEDDRTIYTYGDVIYNPGNVNVVPELIEHESVHRDQQIQIGGPDKWWELYIKDSRFRYHQELEAYGKQYAYFCSVDKNRNNQAKRLWEIAGHLSSEMYKVGMDRVEVMSAIRTKALDFKY